MTLSSSPGRLGGMSLAPPVAPRCGIEDIEVCEAASRRGPELGVGINVRPTQSGTDGDGARRQLAAAGLATRELELFNGTGQRI